jgi:hypothetical protein
MSGIERGKIGVPNPQGMNDVDLSLYTRAGDRANTANTSMGQQLNVRENDLPIGLRVKGRRWKGAGAQGKPGDIYFHFGQANYTYPEP